jgi:hypothetical protein
MEKASKEYFETFGIDKFFDKVKNSKVFKGLLVGSALTGVSSACVNKASVVEAAPLPSADEKSTPTMEVAPTETATLAPTETEDPFEGLNICRTWQEAENCPITVADFERLPDFVKANFEGFPEESMRVKYILFNSESERTSYVSIHVITADEVISGTAVATETSTDKKREYVYGSSLSPIGKPYFFMLEKNSPEINYDNVIAVFPVNNADGSVGTYTIIVPPQVFSGPYKSPGENTKAILKSKFEKMDYLPPVYEMGWIPISGYGAGSRESMANQGDLIDEILHDTNNPNGKRINLFKEWEKTAIIPEELEKLPLFGSDMNLNGGFQN